MQTGREPRRGGIALEYWKRTISILSLSMMCHDHGGSLDFDDCHFVWLRNVLMAQVFKAYNLSNVISKPEPSTVAQDNKDVDETGIEPQYIELVMTQAGVPRAKVVKALKVADGDIVSAIMDLTN
ncbi:Nascent polypeptide-associated complex subunit alpha-like protein 3 [Capsicum chinense]|nr:Nascent polypeptide-associated complex subunit alpha-like protein 3 [Capsicum chinense]